MASCAIKHGDEIDTLMRQWRFDFHKNPETAYEEYRTSETIASLLEEWGITVHRGLAKTGVVGILKGERDGKMIGLRADMDALDIMEQNTFDHTSQRKGKMHACGHDGHCAMLLGAAKYLSQHKQFSGSVVFIFQPAEENVAGGKLMCDEGLFELFPVEEIYAMHNWPDLEAGLIAVHDHEVMASFDLFDITIKGQGSHAAQPQNSIDPIIIAAQFISSLQSIVSRNISPFEPAVVSVTKIHAGDMYNIIPEKVEISGGCRAFSPQVRKLLEERIKEILQATVDAFGGEASIDYQRRYPPTINHPEQAQKAAKVATEVFGAENVIRNPKPDTSAEDFAIMLEKKPGAYLWLGNGRPQPQAGLHNPSYDFNNEILANGASFFVQMVLSN